MVTLDMPAWIWKLNWKLVNQTRLITNNMKVFVGTICKRQTLTGSI